MSSTLFSQDSPQRVAALAQNVNLSVSDSTASVAQPTTDRSGTNFVAKANPADACLNGLAILSADRLCSVGDSGTILLTENAGRTWSIIRSPTTANLNDVHFFDSEHGIAVGGSIGSFTRMSRGVILRTSDGGKTWQSVPTDLPCLLGVSHNASYYICWGHFDPKHQTSVFISSDRGASWIGAELPLGHAQTAAVDDFGWIIGIDSLGRILSENLFNRRLQNSGSGQTAVRSLLHTGEQWIAGGDFGRLQASSDGMQWSELNLPLSTEARRLCQWRSICRFGSNLWVCGSPGSIVLHSADRGATWKILSTRHSLPLEEIRFLDEQRGWAVGPLGRILATRDGGESWYEQRAGGRRAGVLGIASTVAEIPWSALAASAWDARTTTVSAVVRAADLVERAGFQPTQTSQLLQLSRQFGIYGYVYPQIADIQSAAQRSSSPQQLAALLATWRPELVMSCPSRGDEGLADGLMSAIELVKHASRTPVFQELGLTDHDVQKLVTCTEDESRQYSEQSRRVLNALGLAIWDILSPLPPKILEEADSSSLRTLWSQSNNLASQTSLTGAVALSPSTDRGVSVETLGNYQLVMGRIHRRKSLDRLLEDKSDDQHWGSQVDFVLRNLPAHEIAPSAWSLADRLSQAGDLSRTQIVLERLIQHAPASDAASWAMVELLTLQGSDEVQAWQSSLEKSAQFNPILAVRHAHALSEDPRQAAKVLTDPWSVSPFSEVGSDLVVGASATQSAQDQPAAINAIARPQEWFAKYSQFTQFDPGIHDRIDLQFLAQRMAQQMPQADASVWQQLNSLRKATQLVGWQQIANQEYLLSNHQIADARLLALAAPASQRPTLDGQLSEDCWHALPGIQMYQLDNGQSSGNIHWAYDSDFLYVALSCPKSSKEPASFVQRNRRYDSDLGQTDHVELTLDTDRDYLSTIQLAIAADGQTYDRCLGMQEFNPKWHVSVDNSAQAWTAEIAIDLRFLTTRTNLSGQAWAMTAKRSHGLQTTHSWGHLRTTLPLPESAGLLVFIPAAK